MDATIYLAPGTAYAVFLTGLAWLWLAGWAWTRRRHPAATLTEAWLIVYGAAHALVGWLSLLMSAHSHLTLGLRLVLAVPAALLAWKIWREAAVGESHRGGLRGLAGLMAADACLGLIALPEMFLADPLSRPLAALFTLHQALDAMCGLGVLTLCWWLQRLVLPGRSLARRWAPAACFLLVAVLGSALAGSWQASRMAELAAAKNAGTGQGTSVAVKNEGDANPWNQLASERLRSGLPLLAVFLVLVLGLVVAHTVQSHTGNHRPPARRPVR